MCSIRSRPLPLPTHQYKRGALLLTTKNLQHGVLLYAGISNHLELGEPHVSMGRSRLSIRAALQGLPSPIHISDFFSHLQQRYLRRGEYLQSAHLKRGIVRQLATAVPCDLRYKLSNAINGANQSQQTELNAIVIP